MSSFITKIYIAPLLSCYSGALLTLEKSCFEVSIKSPSGLWEQPCSPGLETKTLVTKSQTKTLVTKSQTKTLVTRSGDQDLNHLVWRQDLRPPDLETETKTLAFRSRVNLSLRDRKS